MIKKLIISSVMFMLSAAGMSYADGGVSMTGNIEIDMGIRELQHDWAVVKYQVKDEDKQEQQIAALADKAEAFAGNYPGYAEPKIWAAIIVSTRAGIEGGLGALGHVTRAKELLEAAVKINPSALDGSAYTSLGSLYYQVPGWPLGFGDDDKAKAYLEQARALNPKGIDPNYFYGDFLLQQGEYDKAVQVLELALHAPARPDRPVADSGRRDEIKQAIAKAKENLEN